MVKSDRAIDDFGVVQGHCRVLNSHMIDGLDPIARSMILA
jgi:hypothetical protein